MRSLTRIVLVALAVVAAVPVARVALTAAAPVSVAEPSWAVIPVKQMPVKVRETLQKAVPRAKVTKLEKAAVEGGTLYRVSLTGAKRNVLVIDDTGKLVD